MAHAFCLSSFAGIQHLESIGFETVFNGYFKLSGGAKQTREWEFQAILPLRGKILNTWEVDSGEILASVGVRHISVALGTDPGSHNLSDLRYGKACILADVDGLHIAT